MDTTTTLMGIVGLLCLAVLLWSGRKRFPLRIGTGNFFRRKTQVAIVVAGLLIGTAIITSSYVIQSTFDYTIRSAVFRAFDHVDELIYAVGPGGRHAPFGAAVFDGLEANQSNMPDVARLAPRWQLGGAVLDVDSSLFDPMANVIGFDPARDLGTFVRSDGTAWNGTGLAAGDAIINAKLADAVEARVGHVIAISVGGPNGPAQLAVNVSEIVRNVGRGAWDDGENVFVNLGTFQAALGVPGTINTIIVGNVGGVTEGYLRSDEVVREIEPHLPATPPFTISKLKADAIEEATQNVEQLSQLFVLLGVFTIVAGVLLIINIFVMLAEERKGEMGVARALGMRRANLVQSFVSEGLLYALLSAFVGTFSGLFVAAVILWAFAQIFPADVFGGVGFVLTWTWSDLLQGFAIGFLITMGTIGLASWRVSKLNIVRAIRDIPEPVLHHATRSQVAVGAALAVLGAVGTFVALRGGSLILQDLGPVALALGVAVLTMRLLPPRTVFTAAGAVTLGWVLSPWKPYSTSGADITLFIVAGLLLVLGGLLVVLFNSDAVLGVATRVVRRRTWRPVVRTAIAYPMNKKFRTGVTLASIALVMFTIATMSGIQEMVSSSIETTTIRESAGFDLIGQSGIPIADWDAAFGGYNATSSNITAPHPGLSRALILMSKDPAFGGTLYNTSLLGVPSNWTYPTFEFQALDSNYTNSEEAWAAIQDDPGLAILDGTVVPQNFGPNFASFPAKLGDRLYYRNASGAVHSVRVIGIMYERFVPGIWVGWSTVRAEFGVASASVFYFKVRAGVDPTAAGHDLERYFLRYQFLTFDVRASINEILEVTMGIFNLLEAYLALGLIVGIAGLGVITMRNVVERRQETGALRALGFRKSMVLRSFLFELSFIALTGIALGNVLGIALSYDIYLRFFATQTGSFIVPWARLVLLGGIAFLGSVLATASPAIRAARMPPAEALRTFE